MALKRLTNASLNSLRPRGRTYEVTDPTSRGLQLRVEPTGEKSWVLRFMWRSKRQRVQLARYPAISHAEAQRLAQAARELLDKGIDPRAAERRGRAQRLAMKALQYESADSNPHSVTNLVDEFMRLHIERHLKHPAPVRRLLEANVLRFWARRDARTIKPRDVIELLDPVVERGSPVMANRLACILSQLFRFGVHRALVDDSPVKLLYKPGGRERPRQRVLSDDELRAFFVDRRAGTRFARLAHVMTLLLLTGQRRGELANAQWCHINFQQRTWRIPPEHSKNGRGHTIPLSDWAIQEFADLKSLANKSDWVLPNASGTGPLEAKLLTRGMAKCQQRFRKLGIDPFTLHDLRRTCRTGLARLRVPPHVAERVLNHVQERIPATYDVHDYLEEKRDALAKWSQFLQTLLPPEDAATTSPPTPDSAPMEPPQVFWPERIGTLQ